MTLHISVISCLILVPTSSLCQSNTIVSSSTRYDENKSNEDEPLTYQGLLLIIKKFRKVFKILKRFSIKNAVLQIYVLTEIKKNLC